MQRYYIFRKMWNRSDADAVITFVSSYPITLLIPFMLESKCRFLIYSWCKQLRKSTEKLLESSWKCIIYYQFSCVWHCSRHLNNIQYVFELMGVISLETYYYTTDERKNQEAIAPTKYKEITKHGAQIHKYIACMGTVK